MKLSFIINAISLMAISTVGLLLTSCNKDTTPVENTTPERISVSIGVSSGVSTKATGITDENEKNIKNLQVFVFREDCFLDAYSRSSEESLSVSCTAGQRTVYALVNAPSLTTVSTLSDFMKSSSLLYENDTDAFQMIGGTQAELYSGASIEIPVKRIVSRIRIEKITTDFTSDVYKNADFSIDRIYLVNVPASTKISDFAIINPTSTITSDWLNKKEECSDLTKFLCDDMINYSLSNKEQYTTVHTFYTYPNRTQEDSSESTWCSRFTRLVVEATLSGVKYYYPISLENIGSNKSYIITNLTITRPGSLSADIPVTKAECSFSARLCDWSEENLDNQEI